MNEKIYINGKYLEGAKMVGDDDLERQRDIFAIKIYESAFIYFGLLPMLLLLDEFEENEVYLECHYIKIAMQNVNKNYGTNYCSRLSDEAYLQAKNDYKDETEFAKYVRRLPKIYRELCKYVHDKR